jgi:hypothetical protein
VILDVIRYLIVGQSMYFVIEGDDRYNEQNDYRSFVSATGYFIHQLTAELAAVVAYRFGSASGAFKGSVGNEEFPLCEADFWAESSTPGIRTWTRTEHGFLLFPYALADIRTVTRFGYPVISLPGGKEIVISRGGDGLTFSGFTLDERQQILKLSQEYSLPVVEDERVGDYVDPNGYFTY